MAAVPCGDDGFPFQRFFDGAQVRRDDGERRRRQPGQVVSFAYGFDRDRMPEGLRLLLTGELSFVFALVNADGLQVWGHIALSPLFHLEIWVGVALLLMVALFIARYDFIIGGQLVPSFKGSRVFPRRLHFA